MGEAEPASMAIVGGAIVNGGPTIVGGAIVACRNLLWLVCASSPAPALLRSEGGAPSTPAAPAAAYDAPLWR